MGSRGTSDRREDLLAAATAQPAGLGGGTGWAQLSGTQGGKLGNKNIFETWCFTVRIEEK